MFISFEPGEQHKNVHMRCPIHQFLLFFREQGALLDPSHAALVINMDIKQWISSVAESKISRKRDAASLDSSPNSVWSIVIAL